VGCVVVARVARRVTGGRKERKRRAKREKDLTQRH
jgi:hypothetical protein